MTIRCSICGEEIIGDEHNAMPATTGICCESCNNNVVTPIRIYGLGSNQKEGLFYLDELQSGVDGYIEYYPTNNKKYKIIVNEEGLLMRLPLNKLASNIFGIHAVGNVLIIPNRLLE